MKKAVLKTKVFQVFCEKYSDKGEYLSRDQRKYKTICIGEVVFTDRVDMTLDNNICGKNDVRDEIWDAFNWTCWGCRNRRNMRLYAIRKGMRHPSGWFKFYPYPTSRGYCNADIFFRLDGVFYAAKFCGWAGFDTFAEAERYIIDKMRF